MQRGVIPRWQFLMVYVLIVAAAGLGLWKTGTVAGEADQLATDIQEQRVQTVRRNCEDQNARHFEADRTLTKLIARGRRTHSDGTKLLIEALAPYRDCDQAVRDATRPP